MCDGVVFGVRCFFCFLCIHLEFRLFLSLSLLSSDLHILSFFLQLALEFVMPFCSHKLQRITVV